MSGESNCCWPISPLMQSERAFCDTAYKRLSDGRFRWWPSAAAGAAARALAAHQLHVLLRAGDPDSTKAAPDWRPVLSA
jgi:hypothetical protein